MLHLRDKENRILALCSYSSAHCWQPLQGKKPCKLFSQSCDKHALYLPHTPAVKLTFKTLEAGIMLMIFLPLIVRFGSLNHWRPEKRTGPSAAVSKYTGHCLMMNKLVLRHLHEDKCCRGVLRWRCVSAHPGSPWWQQHHHRDMWGQRGILIQLLRSGNTKLLKHLQRNLKRCTAVFVYVDTH